MERYSLIAEFIVFIREEKKWWLIPLLVVFGAVGMLAILAETSPLGPLMYEIF